MRFLHSCILISLLVFAGCGRAAFPLPPIRPASAEVASLRIFVINASNEAAAAAGETTVTGYDIMMRHAVQRSLTRAGFTLVVSPKDPTDLLAKVDVESPSVYQSSTASMTLATPDGVVIEQVSGIISLDENVDIDERGPVALVEKAARSPRIGAFAKGHRRSECEKIVIPGKKVLEVPAEGNESAEEGANHF